MRTHKHRVAHQSHTLADKRDSRGSAPDKLIRLDLQKRVADAIGGLRQIEFIYEREFCIVEPYLLGTNSYGVQVLKGWQIYGVHPGWRVFRVDQMLSLFITKNVFSPVREGPTSELHLKAILVRVPST
ncbi:MAG: hypothetical protein JO022_19725 [Acidobacteriaceae bacterium]|nr:hypothetical protein [Acidobacteriaceae bacterium]